MSNEFRKYYLSEFQFNDGELDITFNIVDINTDATEITVAVSNNGKISLITYPLFRNEQSLYFEYGPLFEKINLEDFEEDYGNEK